MKYLPTLLALLALLAQPASAQEIKGPEGDAHPLQTQCAMNLLEVGQHLRAFAEAHDGRLPSKLSEAFDETTWEYLLCPEDQPRVVEGGFRPSYAYVHIAPDGRKLNLEAEDILAFDVAPLHHGGRNVLLSNLEVTFVEEAEFQNWLEEDRLNWLTRGGRVQVVDDDLFPLTDEQAEKMGPPSFLQSTHFKAIVGILIAIVIVWSLLVMQTRRGEKT